MTDLPAVAGATDFTLIATKPAEMERAQRELIAWAEQKIASEKLELADARDSLELAIKNGWRHGALQRAVSRIANMVEFYEKLKVALDAGYYIVPPFPIDIFTIRTGRKKPRGNETVHSWHQFTQTPQLLPAGEGRYVDPNPVLFQRTYPPGDHTPDKAVTVFFPDEFRDVTFPFALAKPKIMEATAAAMALKVFDQLGCLPERAQTKCDPIVCGQILKPDRWRTPVTFFVAWWLDTRTL